MTMLLCAVLAASNAWAVVQEGNHTIMNGDMGDIARARRFAGDAGAGYLWFRHDGHEYIVRDDGVLRAIEDAVRPQVELGQLQSELGRHQADLGQQQAKLGERQARLGRRQAQRGLDHERQNPDDETEQRELSKAQSALGREQQKIGREQQKMGRQQQALSKQFQARVEQLIEASLKDGTAKRVD